MPVGLEEFFAKYKLHQESVTYIKEVVGDRADRMLNLSIDELRASVEDCSKKYGGEEEFDGCIKEFKVPSVASSAGIMITVAKPRTCKPRTPIVVYFHGGGFIAGSRETDDQIIKKLARDAECIFISVEFRLAPENKFPAPFDDAKCVMRWVMMNKSLIGGVNDSKVGVLGVGSGGTIAATVCHEVPSISFQILAYPILDMRFGQPSFQEFADSPLKANEFLQMSCNMFLNENTESENPRASPLLRLSSISNLPPALFILADVCPVKDQGYEYRRIIKDCGVDTDSLLIRGSVHDFFSLPGHFKELGAKAQEKVVLFIKKRGAS